MPHRVDPAMQPVQAPAADPAVDRVFSQPQLEQLPTRHNPVLTPRQLGNRAVVTASLL